MTFIDLPLEIEPQLYRKFNSNKKEREREKKTLNLIIFSKRWNSEQELFKIWPQNQIEIHMIKCGKLIDN